VVNESGQEGFVPDLKALAELRLIMKAERELMGADAPTRIELGGTVENEGGGEEIASDALRFMELADMVARHGYGSGRYVDADEVGEGDHQDELEGGIRVSGPGGEQVIVPELGGGTNDVDPEPEVDRPEVANGHWVGGHFVSDEEETKVA
jgi:hypothetical protein